MSFIVPFDLGYEFEVKARYGEVFSLLSDVPASAGHFPKLAALEKTAPNTYQWTMERVGTEQAGLQTTYASRYGLDRKKGLITWVPVKGIGNAQVSGSWSIIDKKKSTHLTLRLKGDLTVPLPAIMQPMLTPVIVTEYEKLVEQYIDNLVETFGGEV